MKSGKLKRREFFEKSAAAGLALALGPQEAGLSAAAKDSPVRIGFIGVGSRGTVLLRLALMMDAVEVPAICDVDESHTARAQRLVQRRGFPKPAGYSKGPEDYKRMLDERDDLDAVICATPWEWHTPMMVATMEAGIYGGVEVPAAISVDECWQLVETSEKTGVSCMMLENYCYFRNVMLILNMLDQGLFGDLVHSEVGYQKDERFLRIGPDGELGKHGKLKTTRNGNLYPTHAVGPAAWSMNVNRGDRFDYLVSMSSRSRHLHDYLVEKFGPDHPAAEIEFTNGDVNTTLIRTKKGRTITVYYDTQSPRPWDPIQRFQGSKGIFMASMNKIYVEGLSPLSRTWENVDRYYETYEHPLWKKYGHLELPGLGRGVCEYLVTHQFIEAVRRRSITPLDVYDATAWSAITPLSEKSVANRSTAVDFPDFTRGKWQIGQERIYYDV